MSVRSCEKSDFWCPQNGRNLTFPHLAQICRLGCSNAPFAVSGTSCEKSDFCWPQIGQKLKPQYWAQICKLGCFHRYKHKSHHLMSPGRVVKNRTFGDLKSVKILNRPIKLKFAGKAAFIVTNTKRTICRLRDELWIIGVLLTSSRSKSKTAVLSSNL